MLNLLPWLFLRSWLYQCPFCCLKIDSSVTVASSSLETVTGSTRALCSSIFFVLILYIQNPKVITFLFFFTSSIWSWAKVVETNSLQPEDCMSWYDHSHWRYSVEIVYSYYSKMVVIMYLYKLSLSILFLYFLKDFIYLFLDRGERKEKERERNINVWLPIMHPLLWTWPATQACALTGKPTSDPLLCSPALTPLSHISQSYFYFF